MNGRGRLPPVSLFGLSSGRGRRTDRVSLVENRLRRLVIKEFA